MFTLDPDGHACREGAGANFKDINLCRGGRNLRQIKTWLNRPDQLALQS
jgi:hypothetical protein